MPVINPNTNAGPNNQQRTTFRPPWVKDGPSPLPMPTAPWTSRAREGNTSNSENTRGTVNALALSQYNGNALF